MSGWPRGPKTAVITSSGGASSLVSYLADGAGVELPDYPAETKRRLSSVLPAFGTPQNPLDTTGVIVNQPDLLPRCVDAVVAEQGYDAVFVNVDPAREPGLNPAVAEERVKLLAEAIRRSPVFTMLAQTVVGELTPYTKELLERYELHFANGVALGAAALGNAIRYGEAVARARGRRAPVRRAPTHDKTLAGVLTEVAAKALLARYEIGAPAERLASEPEAAVAAAHEIGFPVVMKIQSPEIVHKSEAGGVRIGVADEEQVRRTYDSLVNGQTTARIEGVLVARQVAYVAELIAGIKIDPLFGPVVLVGSGGIFAETIQDTSLRLPPIDADMAHEMLAELRGAPLLMGARGRPPADLDSLAGVLVQLGNLALDYKDQLLELDINPLFALENGALAGDALAIFRD
jgi:acyl-CoA synthetase (NDP forming)